MHLGFWEIEVVRLECREQKGHRTINKIGNVLPQIIPCGSSLNFVLVKMGDSGRFKQESGFLWEE